MKGEPLIKVEKLEKIYQGDENSEYTLVLSDINLTIDEGDFVVIYGPSGSGKSTLLHHIVGLETPTKGKVLVKGTDLTKLTPEERAIFRAKNIGMVYQLWYWAKSLSVWENVALPLLISGVNWDKAFRGAIKSLEDVKMSAYAKKKPMQLSGGEQQRICLARALVNDPLIIVADEPTGNLDSKKAQEVMDVFLNLNRKLGRTVIIVTHNLSYLSLATKTIALRDGKIVSSDKEAVRKQIEKELEGVS